MTLSDKAANQKIILLDNLSLEDAKTKKFFEILQNLNLREKKIGKKTIKKDASKKEVKKKQKKEKSILVILPKKDEKVQRAAKNITRLKLIQANSLNVLDIISSNYLLMPVDSINEIEKFFDK